MPSLTGLAEDKSVKMLLIGDSGTGKTGCLASLAKAGYKLRVWDFDNGLDILAMTLKGDKAMENVSYQTFRDEMTTRKVGNKVQIIPKGNPAAFADGMQQLNHWKTEDEDLGPATEWDKDCVIVIDSLDIMGKAALEQVLSMQGRLGSPPQIQDWGAAMEALENLIRLLTSDAIACHVIVITHVATVTKDGSLMKGYPAALGEKLPPKIGAYFNSTLIAKVSGSGSNQKRTLVTVPDGVVEAKSPVTGMPSKLPIETGMADYFKAYLAAR